MSEHTALIDGLRAIYSLLVAMNYLSPAYVLDPNTNPDAHAAAISDFVLSDLALDPLAIDVIRKLPLISDEASEELTSNDLIHIRPDESPFSFSQDADANADVFNAVKQRIGSEDGDSDNEMPAWVFPITKFPVDTVSGLWHFYDAKTCSIVSFDDSQGSPDDRYPYPSLPHQTPQAFFTTWFTNLQTLTWLPWSYTTSHHTRAEIHPLPDLDALRAGLTPDDLPAAESSTNALGPLNSAKNRFNQYWCRRQVYEDAGWPDSFDVVEFERRKGEWQEREAPLLRQWRSMKWDAQMGSGWSALVRQGAGERGVDV